MSEKQNLAWLWGVVAVLTCHSVAGLEPSLLEEGFHLQTAQRIVAGEHLFRDIASFTGPLPFEFLALLFRFFGDEIAVARGAIALLHGAATASVFALVREDRPSAAHIAAAAVSAAPILLFPLFVFYFYTTIATLLCAIAAFATLRGLRSPGWAITAGITIAFIALCKQTVGAAIAISLAVATLALAPRRARATAWLAAGGAGITALTLLWYAGRGEVGLLIDSLVFAPLSFDATYNSPFPNLWPPGTFSPEIKPHQPFYLPSLYTISRGAFTSPGVGFLAFTQFLYGFPFACLLAAPLVHWRRRLTPATWIQVATLAALITNLFPRTDWGHLVFVIPTSIVLLILLLPARQKQPTGKIRRVALATAVTMMAATSATSFWLHSLSGDASYGDRVPLRPVTSSLRLPYLPRVIDYLRERVRPGEAIFVARAEPLLYYATDTVNPTPYGGIIPGMREEQQGVILEALEKVRFAVMSDIDQPLFLYYSKQLPAVQRYFERHYRVVRKLAPSHWTLLERGRDRGATAIDLIDASKSAKPWVRDTTGTYVVTEWPDPLLITVQNYRSLAFLLGASGGGMDFKLQLPEGSPVFQGGVGLRTVPGLRVIYEHPNDVDMIVSIRQDEERFQRVARRHVVLDERRGWRWLPIEADLTDYAGERVTLRIELSSATPLTVRHRIGWWGSPRIAIPPGTTHREARRGRAELTAKGGTNSAPASRAAAPSSRAESRN